MNKRYIFFFIILMCLIFVLFNNNNNTNTYDNKVSNNKLWDNYRLGDIISWMPDAIYLAKNKKDSIGYKYIKATIKLKQKKQNYKVLNDIVKYDYNNKICLHLRLGDVILGYKNNKFSILKNPFNNVPYAYQPEKYKCLKNILKNEKDKTIYLFYGLHKDLISKYIKRYNVNYSVMYINMLKKILTDDGFLIKDMFTGNPDKDFEFMVNSKIFIKCNGGFSEKISELVKLRSNKVIDLKDYK